MSGARRAVGLGDSMHRRVSRDLLHRRPSILGRLPPRHSPPLVGTPFIPLMTAYQRPVVWPFDNSEAYAEFIVWTMEE